MMKEEADLKSTSVALLNPDDPRAEAKARRRARNDKMVKIMRFIQSTLGAILSIIIAVFQGRVYWTYQKTQSQPGTWPAVPNTMPTILLFSVAVAALVFDICMLVAYMWPSSRYARWAVVIGGGMHTVVASTKTVSFAIAAVVSKTTFDYGNSSGTNGDLWSYTCTDQAETLNNVIQSDSNCNGQWAAWGFALGQLFIEILGWIITVLAFLQSSPPLTAQAMEERFTAYSGDVNSRMNDITPQFDVTRL